MLRMPSKGASSYEKLALLALGGDVFGFEHVYFSFFANLDIIFRDCSGAIQCYFFSAGIGREIGSSA